MSAGEIVLVVVLALAFAAAIAAIVYGKVRRKGGCDCGGNCAACGCCAGKHQPRHKKKG